MYALKSEVYKIERKLRDEHRVIQKQVGETVIYKAQKQHRNKEDWVDVLLKGSQDIDKRTTLWFGNDAEFTSAFDSYINEETNRLRNSITWSQKYEKEFVDP